MNVHALYINVRDSVKAKGLPFDFVYGPPQVPEKVGGTRIFMAHDDEAGDAILPARSQHNNPKQVGVRSIGMRVVIFARDTVEGAQRHEHEALALQLANMVHVALHRAVTVTHKTLWRMRAVGFAADATTDGWNGRVYVMRFHVDTPIADRTYQGAAKPEGSFASPVTSLTATGAGAPTDLPSATTRVP